MSAPEVDIDQLESALAAGTPLIDVRENDEYLGGHVPGATLIPMSEMMARVEEVPTEGEVYVICFSGQRSLKVAEFLRGRGVDASSVAGGTKAWYESGRPVVPGADPG
jgi:rhodanese-related sulfurtransferase